MKLISAFALLSTATAIADVVASPPVHRGSLRGRALDYQDASLGPLPKGPSVPCRTNAVRCPSCRLYNGKVRCPNDLLPTPPDAAWSVEAERIEDCQNGGPFLVKVDDTCWLSENEWMKAPRFLVAFEIENQFETNQIGMIENMDYLRSTGLPATAGCESLCYKSVYAHSTTKNAIAMIHQLMDSHNFVSVSDDSFSDPDLRKFGYFVGYCGKDVRSNLQSCTPVYH